MNNLRRIIRQLLSESKREYTNVLQQYQSKGFSQEEIVKILNADPTNSGGTKNTLYSRWMVQQVLEKNESLDEIAEAIKQYHNFYRKQEFYKNKGAPEIELQPPFSKKMSFQKLKDWIKFHPKDYAFSKVGREERYEKKGQESDDYKQIIADLVLLKGADQIYSDDEWRVIVPYTKEACIKIGIGTKHCISEKDQEYFKQYVKEGATFFYVIQKEAEEFLKKKFIKYENDPSSREHIYEEMNTRFPNWKNAWVLYLNKVWIKFPSTEIFNAPDDQLMDFRTPKDNYDESYDSLLNRIAGIYNKSADWVKKIYERMLKAGNEVLPLNDLKYSKGKDDIDTILRTTDNIDVLKQASRSPDLSYVRLVAINPNTPKELIIDIINMKDRSVLYYIIARKDLTYDITKMIFDLGIDSVNQSLLTLSILPEEFIIEVLKNKDKTYNIANQKDLASNKNLPTKFMYYIVETHKPKLFKQLALNPNAPSEVLDKLIETTYDDVINAVGSHSNFASFDRYIEVAASYGRRNLAARADLPIDIQHKLAKDKNANVRAALVDNKFVEREVLKVLATDEDTWVARDAKRKLAEADAANIRTGDMSDSQLIKILTDGRGNIKVAQGFYARYHTKGLSRRVFEELIDQVDLSDDQHGMVLMNFIDYNELLTDELEYIHDAVVTEYESGGSSIDRDELIITIINSTNVSTEILERYASDEDDYYVHDAATRALAER